MEETFFVKRLLKNISIPEGYVVAKKNHKMKEGDMNQFQKTAKKRFRKIGEFGIENMIAAGHRLMTMIGRTKAKRLFFFTRNQLKRKKGK